MSKKIWWTFWWVMLLPMWGFDAWIFWLAIAAVVGAIMFIWRK